MITCKCVVCEREYEPDLTGRVYCTAKCAWNSDTTRSKESMVRELEALKKALETIPS